MRSFLRTSTLFLLAVWALIATTQPALAGPLAPCIRATLSAHGKILVVNDLTFSDPDESHARRPTISTFQVLRQSGDGSDRFRMNGPNAYWDTNSLWSLVLTHNDQDPICPYLLVTDDGAYLILISGGAQFETALSIYRRRDYPDRPHVSLGPDHGMLIKRIPLSDLWPPQKVPTGITDHTAPWSSGGTFSFSADDRTLIHTTRWGTTFHINLETGAITSTSIAAKQTDHTDPR